MEKSGGREKYGKRKKSGELPTNRGYGVSASNRQWGQESTRRVYELVGRY